MASLKEVIRGIERLRPEQVDEVARFIHYLSQTERGEGRLHPAVPTHVMDEAAEHGWPPELFTELIGSLQDLERPAEPPVENRSSL